jgi:hypothetical protein
MQQLIDMVQYGYNLDEYGNGLLNGIISAVNSAGVGNEVAIGNSTRDIVGAINGLAGSLGGDGTGSISGGVAEGINQWGKDTTGMGEWGDSLGAWDNEFGGGSGNAMGDSLGDGSGARRKIKNAIGIDSSSFAFLGSNDNRPVFVLSFNAGIVSCHKCEIDLCNVYGFNAAQVIRALIWLFALVTVLWMDLEVLKKGGH